MRIKIDNVTELMFAQAVALSQSGKMKSTLHVGGDEIFIKNMDNTILIRFESQQEFSESFSFFANDYESPRILVEDGKVAFITNQGGYRRKKVCPQPKQNFKELKKLWQKYSPDREHSFSFNSVLNTLLEDSLSHIEISKKVGESAGLIQRDIYSGSRVEVAKNNSSDLFQSEEDSFSFNTIGIRTNDFKALFSFVDDLFWYFQPKKNWVFIEDREGKFQIILSTCLYDEIGYLAIEEE